MAQYEDDLACLTPDRTVVKVTENMDDHIPTQNATEHSHTMWPVGFFF